MVKLWYEWATMGVIAETMHPSGIRLGIEAFQCHF
jgi:hypothetical protein